MRSYSFIVATMMIAALSLASYSTAASCDLCYQQCSGISESGGCSNGPNYYNCTSANRQKKANCQSSCRNTCNNQQAPASSSRSSSASSTSKTNSPTDNPNSATSLTASLVLVFLLPFIYSMAF